MPFTADLEEKSSEPSSNRKAKTFSLHTYKFHALGHVVTNIKRFGCSDNYSTQGVSIGGILFPYSLAEPVIRG